MDITAYIYMIHILGYQSAVTIQVIFWAEVTSAFLQIIPESKIKHIYFSLTEKTQVYISDHKGKTYKLNIKNAIRCKEITWNLMASEFW